MNAAARRGLLRTMHIEEDIAQIVEFASHRLGMPLGNRTRRDESHEGGLSVDFTYDDPPAGEPAALEVTSLRDQRLTQSFAGMSKFEQSIRDVVVREGLGGWICHLEADARLKDMQALLLNYIRQGREIRPGHYTSDDLMATDDPAGLISEHDRLRARGLVALERWDHAGFFLGMGSSGRGVGGFGDLLAAEIGANADKLDKCRPRQTHLAVDVLRFDASTMPDRTPPPDLPAAVDHLWLTFGWKGAATVLSIWYMARGAPAWDLIPDPRWSHG